MHITKSKAKIKAFQANCTNQKMETISWYKEKLLAVETTISRRLKQVFQVSQNSTIGILMAEMAEILLLAEIKETLADSARSPRASARFSRGLKPSSLEPSPKGFPSVSLKLKAFR